MYRFGVLPIDPRIQTEDLGDDPVLASHYGIENLKRVLPNLVQWTATEGNDYADLEELYGELLSQWNRYVGHVLTVIGGVYQDLKTADQEGVVYSPVPRVRQKAAMRFLTAQLLETPTWLNDPEILARIEHAGSIDRIRSIQVRRLQQLLDPGRMQRLIEAQVFHPDEAYDLLEFLDDLRQGVWREITDDRAIDTYRRNLQRGYLEHMESLMSVGQEVPRRSFGSGTPVQLSQSDIRAFVRGQLKELKAEAQRAADRTSDLVTRYHLEDVVFRIDKILSEEE